MCTKGICHLYNARITAMIEDWEAESATYYLIGNGRNNNESSVVYVEKGHYLGFGFLILHWDKHLLK